MAARGRLVDALRERVRRAGHFERSVLLIAAAGLAFRWLYILLAKARVDTCGQQACGDAIWYSSTANMLGHWAGFVDRLTVPGESLATAAHGPLTPVAIAPATILTFGHHPTAQRLLMAFYGACVIIALGYLVRRLAGDRAGLIAATLAAANANFFMNDVIVMAETIAALTLILLLITTYRFIDEPTNKGAALVGLLVGLAGLARAELLLFGPVMVVPVVLARRELPWRQRLARLSVAGATALLVLLPWTAYNLSRFDEPVLLSTNDGLTLLGANCDAVYGVDDPGGIGFWNLNCAAPVDAVLPPDADESVKSRAYRDAAVDYIRANHVHLPKVIAIRLLRGWGAYGPDQMVWLNQGEGRDSWASVLGYVTWWAMVPLAVAGAVILRRRQVSIWPLVSSAVVVTLTLVAFYGIVRFRLAADVAVTALAAVAIDALVRWWHQPKDLPNAADPAAAGDAMVGTPAGEPAHMSETSAGTHFPCLDAYRGIGMTMVLLNHAAYSTGYVFRSDLGPYIARLDISVPMFFVLSGFLLYRPFARSALEGRSMPSTHRFYRRRALRILPAYWVALVGIGVLFGLHISGTFGWIANALLLPALGVPAEVCTGAQCRVAYGITQAWSIGVEATYYLVLPAIALLIGRVAATRPADARLRVLLTGTGLLYAAGAAFRFFVVATEPGWARESLLWLPMYLDLFAVGMALAALSAAAGAGRPLPRAFAWLSTHPALCWCAAGAIYLLMTRLSPPDEPFGLNGVEYLPRQFCYGVASAIWLLPAMFGDQTHGRLRRVLASKPLVYLGAISLSFYLWHLVLIEAAKRWTVPDYGARVALATNPPPGNDLAALATFVGDYWKVALIAWGLSFGVASLLHRWVEVPFLRLKDGPLRQLLPRRASTSQQIEPVGSGGLR
jgi:peptidoglycan/LPS O-acetylase OafA/YrhL